MLQESNKTLWLDVTMLVNWSGRMTGIQRVEYNLAKRFAEDYEDVKFCVFDKKNNHFIDFDFKHIDFKVRSQQEDISNEPLAHDTVSTHGVSHQTKAYVKWGLKKVLPAPIKNVAKRGYATLRSVSDSRESISVANIQSNHTLLILSGDWSDYIFAEHVAKMKKEKNIKVVQIIYDMLPALYPSYFVVGMPKQFSEYMKRILQVCDGVLAISESTKKDVAAFMKSYKMVPVPIEVFRLGDDFVKTSLKKPQQLDVRKKEYILTVCTVEARKNHALLYYVMREAVTKGIEIPTMVFAGKQGWLVDDLYYLIKNDPVISKKIQFANGPSDSELAWLYENSLFTVFPSFYEGWGLPVAESLFYGKFCLSSSTSSMPEIAGDLIDYFSPNDPIDLLGKIKYYTLNQEALELKEATIQKNYKTTSWDEAYKQVKLSLSKL